MLSIDVQTLAAQAHVHRNMISRAQASESVQKFLREALRVMRAAHDLSGDAGRSISALTDATAYRTHVPRWAVARTWS